MSAYLELAAEIGLEVYTKVASRAYLLGEPLYQALLYPERREVVRRSWAASAQELIAGSESVEGLFDRLLTGLDRHVDAVIDEIGENQLVGLTTCFGQLFANLVLAKRLKERRPEVTTILGGSTVSGRVGPSLLREYDFIDYIVQGEGERPLVGLLDVVAAGTPERPVPGVLSRLDGSGLQPAALSEVGSLDELPLPDFDEYAARADAHGLAWSLAVEGSRGCWWDRTKRSGNPTATCYFCNLNVQWNGYREKSVARVVKELAELSDRYGVLDAFFLDNIIRVKGTAELARGIRSLGKDFRIFYELRANISQHDILLLWEAGLREAQFGIEGLSTSYLKRIGKGTTAIQNLAVMKTCQELGIDNVANLITHFPGATEEEIAETVEHIDRYAVVYRPLDVVPFALGVESAVEVLQERFGVRNVRNADHLRPGLPPHVFERVHLMELAFDCDSLSESWSKVEDAATRWADRFGTGSPKLLMYQDGGSFLRILDLRQDPSTTGILRGVERDVYLYGCDVRSRRDFKARFPHLTSSDLDQLLGAFLAEDLMFREGDRFLSLAMAHDAQAAARRIAAQAAEPTARPRGSLTLLVD